jgi:hypothetical protein
MKKIALGKIKNYPRQIKKSEDLKDYLDVLEARKNSLGKKIYTQTAIEARYSVKI